MGLLRITAFHFVRIRYSSASHISHPATAVDVASRIAPSATAPSSLSVTRGLHAITASVARISSGGVHVRIHQ